MDTIPVTSRPTRSTDRAASSVATTDTLEGMLALEQIAERLSASTLVPLAYQRIQRKERAGKDAQFTQNPSGVSNCMIALDIANRLGMQALMVMQHLYVIDGKPTWSAQMVIASINSSGRFSPLRFVSEERGERVIEYTERVWNRQIDGWDRIPKTVTVNDFAVKAVSTGPSGEEYEGPWVSLEMAVQEGWFQRNDSKWRSPDMARVMARYRAAAFFGRLYAPERLLGLPMEDEVRDIIDVTASATHEFAPASDNNQSEAKIVGDASVATETRTVEEVVAEPTPKADASPGIETAAPTRGKPATEAPKAEEGREAPLISEGQVRVINNTLDRKGISAADLCIALDIDSVPALPKSRVNEALSWIEKAPKSDQ